MVATAVMECLFLACTTVSGSLFRGKAAPTPMLGGFSLNPFAPEKGGDPG